MLSHWLLRSDLLWSLSFCISRSQLFHTRSFVLCLHKKKYTKDHNLFFFLNIYSAQTISSFSKGNLNIQAQLKSSFCSSTHTPLSGWFPSKLGSAKPKPHQQQKPLKVKTPDLKVGHRPDTGRGDILHRYFREALLLKHECGLILGAPSFRSWCCEYPKGMMQLLWSSSSQ